MGRGKGMEVKFYDTVNDELLKFAVIISQSNGKWVFCKHKERDLQYGSIPFETMPFCTSLIGHNPEMKDIFGCIQESENASQLLARYVQTNRCLGRGMLE